MVPVANETLTSVSISQRWNTSLRILWTLSGSVVSGVANEAFSIRWSLVVFVSLLKFSVRVVSVIDSKSSRENYAVVNISLLLPTLARLNNAVFDISSSGIDYAIVNNSMMSASACFRNSILYVSNTRGGNVFTFSIGRWNSVVILLIRWIESRCRLLSCFVWDAI